MNKVSVTGRSSLSWANLFLLFICKEQTNMTVPWRAHIHSWRYFCCIGIDRTALRSLQMETFARFLLFLASLHPFFGPLYHGICWRQSPCSQQSASGGLTTLLWFNTATVNQKQNKLVCSPVTILLWLAIVWCSLCAHCSLCLCFGSL